LPLFFRGRGPWGACASPWFADPEDPDDVEADEPAGRLITAVPVPPPAPLPPPPLGRLLEPGRIGPLRLLLPDFGAAGAPPPRFTPAAATLIAVLMVAASRAE
jgi:hypothetical protein